MCVLEWFWMLWPASCRAFTLSGNLSTHSPTTKKGCLCLIFAQHRNQLLRILIAPRGVKGEASLFLRCFHAVNRQQLPACGSDHTQALRCRTATSSLAARHLSAQPTAYGDKIHSFMAFPSLAENSARKAHLFNHAYAVRACHHVIHSNSMKKRLRAQNQKNHIKTPISSVFALQ